MPKNPINRTVVRFTLAFIFLVVAIGAWFFPLLGFFIPICMVAGVGTGFFKGRFWCAHICPRGSFYDTLLKAVSPKKSIPPVLKSTLFRVVVLVVLMGLMIFQLIRLWPDPYKIGRLFAILITATTFIGIILGLIFHQRTWCSFCPVGTLAHWAGSTKARLSNLP